MKPLLTAVGLTILLSIAMSPKSLASQAHPQKKVAVVVSKPAPKKVVPEPQTPAPAPVVVAEPVITPPTPQIPVVAPVIVPQPPYSGSHEDWMAAAGIAPSDYGAVDYIVSHESGWNPNATEPNSGAHGLPQALPYSKTGCGWVDPVCQLQWANTYAVARYGGWWAAQAYWVANHNW